MFHDAFGKFVNPQSQTSHHAPELPRSLTFARDVSIHFQSDGCILAFVILFTINSDKFEKKKHNVGSNRACSSDISLCIQPYLFKNMQMRVRELWSDIFNAACKKKTYFS